MIDSHCHINDDLYLNNPEKYIEEGVNAGVNAFLVVGFDSKSSVDACEIAEKYKCCYAAVGIHPSDAHHEGKNDLTVIEKLLKESKAICVGEIGLDYYWEKDQKIRDIQKEYFIKQIELANKYNLPISVHCRDAYQDCFDILKAHPVNKRGIIHCYSGSPEMAKEFVKLGYILGFGGTSTYKNAIKVKETIKIIPSQNYVLETDAPYLPPEGHRGQPNHSKYLTIIRKEIANLREISEELVEQETTENFKRLFNI